MAERRCMDDGLWQEEKPSASLQLEPRPDQSMIDNNIGFTNYTECLLPELRDLMNQIGTGEDAIVTLFFVLKFNFQFLIHCKRVAA